MTQIVSLLTDFGLLDPYVGLMKAMLARTAPQARWVDLSHQMPRHGIETASFWLDRSIPSFPQGTCHLVVVDPTVGSERRGIAAKMLGHTFVCPDDGVLSDVLLRARNGAADSELEVVELDRSLLGSEFTRTGTTFDGRDLFSPAAGKLAAGARLSDLGSALSPLELVTLELHHDPNETRVRAVDVYGNVITDAPALQSSSRVIGNQGRPIPFGSTYADGAPGELIAVRGSFGTIELAINRGSAADLLACRVGDLFQLEKAGS